VEWTEKLSVVNLKPRRLSIDEIDLLTVVVAAGSDDVA